MSDHLEATRLYYKGMVWALRVPSEQLVDEMTPARPAAAAREVTPISVTFGPLPPSREDRS